MAANTDVPEKYTEKLKTYRGCIKSAQQFMADEKYHEDWRAFIKAYSENTNCTDNDGVTDVHVPIAFSNVNIQRAALTVHHPHFTINPRNMASFQAATICEEVINYEWEKHRYQDQIRKCTDDFLVMGNMWAKTGYLLRKWGDPQDRLTTARLDQIPDARIDDFDFDLFESPEFDTEFEKLVEKSRETLWQTHAAGDMLPTRSKLARELRQNGHAVLHDRTMFERVSPFDMLVDPKATCLENAQWVAQRVPVRLDVAQANKSWPKHVRDALGADQKSIAKSDNGTRPEPNYRPSIGSGDSDSEFHQWVETWEFYDLHTGEKAQFAMEGADFLDRPEPTPFRMGHPFIFKGNYSIPDEFFHMGEIEMVLSLQNELNETRSDLVNARKQTRRKYIVEEWLWNSKGSQGKSFKEVVTSPEDNLIAVVGEIPNNKTLDGAIRLLPQHDVDPNMYNIFAAIKSDMNEVTGITDFQRGAGSAGTSTATEAAILNDGAVARLQEKQGKIEQFMRDAARNLVMLKQEYMTTDQVVRITDGGQTQAATQFRDRMDQAGASLPPVEGLFLEYGRNDIVGEFDFDIEAGSSTAYNETARRRQYQELMQTLLPLLPLGIIDVTALITEVLQQGFRIPNAGRFVNQPQQQAPQGPAQNPVTGQPGGGIGGGISTQAGIQAPGGGIPASASGTPPELQALLNQVLPNGTLSN